MQTFLPRPHSLSKEVAHKLNVFLSSLRIIITFGGRYMESSAKARKIIGGSATTAAGQTGAANGPARPTQRERERARQYLNTQARGGDDDGGDGGLMCTTANTALKVTYALALTVSCELLLSSLCPQAHALSRVILTPHCPTLRRRRPRRAIIFECYGSHACAPTANTFATRYL